MAVSIEKDMWTLLNSSSSVTDYVGANANSRIYWVSAPTDPAYPYIVYDTIAANGVLRYLGLRTADTLVQFSVFHTHKQDGIDLANAVFDALSAYHGSPGDKTIHYISCNGPRGMRDPDYETVYQYIIDAEVRYER